MMKKWQSRILKKAAALLIALAMLLSVLPAAVAASPDWSQMVITVSWMDALTGEIMSVHAFPVTETETGEGCFWIALPPGTPLEGLYISAVHPLHEDYIYSLSSDYPLEGIMDAGEYLDGITYLPLSVITNPETGEAEVVEL